MAPSQIDYMSVSVVSEIVTVPFSSAGRERWYAAQVVSAHKSIESFAARYRWADRMEIFWRHGFEIYDDRIAFWNRILDPHELEPTTALPGEDG